MELESLSCIVSRLERVVVVRPKHVLFSLKNIYKIKVFLSNANNIYRITLFQFNYNQSFVLSSVASSIPNQ